MEMAGKHSDHYFCRWQAKIVTTINIFFEKNEKNEKCLELSDLARQLIGKLTTVPNHTNTHTMFTASSYTPKLQSIILFSMMLWALRCALNLSLLLNFLEQVGQTFKQSSLCWISSARMKNSMSHLIEQHSQVADILACYRDRVANFLRRIKFSDFICNLNVFRNIHIN